MHSRGHSKGKGHREKRKPKKNAKPPLVDQLNRSRQELRKRLDASIDPKERTLITRKLQLLNKRMAQLRKQTL